MRLLTALLLALQAAAAPPRTADIHGTWTVELGNGQAFLQTRTSPPPDWNRSGGWDRDWSMGRSVAIDELSGLPSNDDALTAAAVRFELRREAGTLAFEGAFRDGRGAGLFTFTPRPEFDAEMRRLGYTDELPTWRRYQLAMQDVGPRYVTALKAEGYDKLALDEIVRAHNHGVTLDYIRAMKAAGYHVEPIEDLVRTRDHGVTPAYIHDLAAHGFTHLPLADVVRARDHGVTADYIADMQSIAKSATLAQIVRMRDHGVTPGFVGHARARGFTTTDPDELIRLRDRGLNDR